MKSNVGIFLCGILTATFTVMIHAEAAKPGTAVVTGSRVNVRGRPLGTAERCCQLDEGEKVTVLDSTYVANGTGKSDEWARIVLPDKATVWVQSAAIADGKILKDKTPGRAGSSLMWPVLCTLNKGDTINVRTNHLDWTGIVPPPSASAYISSLFISNVVDEVPTAPIAKPQENQSQKIEPATSQDETETK